MRTLPGMVTSDVSTTNTSRKRENFPRIFEVVSLVNIAVTARTHSSIFSAPANLNEFYIDHNQKLGSVEKSIATDEFT